MELLFLGTGSGVPSKQRNVTSIALKLLDEINSVWLFDCGEGTQQQILRTTIKPRKIDRIFITHLHGDHIYGLPGFLASRAFQGGDGALTIYGPVGIERFVRTALKISGTYLRYALTFHEIKQEGVVYKDNQFTVSCMELKHGIQSYGFRIEEASRPGMLQAEKVKEAGIPFGPLYGKLKKGETIQLEDGRVFNGQDFIDEPQNGRIVTILGDTKKTENSVVLAKDADVLVHESTFDHENRHLAKEYNHSTNVEAAETAKTARVKKLLLTHISARFLPKDIHHLEKEARKIFPNTCIMRDFSEVEIPLKKGN